MPTASDHSGSPSETINSVGSLQDGIDAGLDGIITDDPATLEGMIPPADPSIVAICATDPHASEAGLDPGEFVVTRAGGGTAEALRVYYDVSGTAANGSDYVMLAGAVELSNRRERLGLGLPVLICFQPHVVFRHVKLKTVGMGPTDRQAKQFHVAGYLLPPSINVCLPADAVDPQSFSTQVAHGRGHLGHRRRSKEC